MAATKMNEEDETDMELAQKGHILEEFSEAETVKSLFKSLPNIYNDMISVELAIEQFTRKYRDWIYVEIFVLALFVMYGTVD